MAQSTTSPVVNAFGSSKVNGTVYGGAIGYDLPVASILSIGADAEINGSTGRHNFGSSYLRIGRDLYVGGRVSLKILPSTRIYGKLGYANGNFASEAGYYGHGLSMIFSDNVNLSGIRAGAGIQQTIFGPAYVLAEYRYTNYSSGFTRNQVVTGVGVRF
ncbi:outer membrane protein [Novosphingobium sp. KACC 22771]|uniref:outer membrane protein n=1 Tax=Novosphingobium sp. KACC 22771 TaxID=3025670 RepID=UPI0030824FC1